MKTYQSSLKLLAVLVVGLSVTLFSQMPDRSKPPELGPTPSLKMNAVQKLYLANGLPVIVYEKHDVPIVQMYLVINAGSVNESENKLGLAGMTASMMDEGAAGKSSLELSDAIDFLGASISASGGLHSSSVSLRCAVSKFDESLKLFSDILLRPDFPQNELNRLRTTYLTSLMQGYDQPRVIAAAAFSKYLYGSNHPYGRTSVGTEKTLWSLSVNDLKNFYSTYYKPNNAYLIVVGDVTANEILAKLETAIGGWKQGTLPAAPFPKIKQINGRKIFLIDKPEAAQSIIRIGRVGAERMTEDYFPLQVMNTILGGSFTSRLNNNLREEHGYSYGAGSGFSFRPYAGPFIASADVQTNVTDKALIEFMKKLNEISQPVSDEELIRAKNYLALSYPDNFSNAASIAGQLADMMQYHLPENYFTQYIDKIMSVTKEDVQRVAKKYIDTNNLEIIVVGDKAKIEEGIKKTKIAKIQNESVIDVLGPMPNLR
ncbi:MAG: insulinase family protein [Bacteroidetes bacterium]|nr:insulinase family protein [Bacteroidota bacterium]